MTRNKNKSNSAKTINNIRLAQEQEKLLALQKKNDSLLPDQLDNGECRLCGHRTKFSPEENFALAEELAALVINSRQYRELPDDELRDYYIATSTRD